MSARLFKYVVSVSLIAMLVLPALAFLPSAGAQDGEVYIFMPFPAPSYEVTEAQPVWLFTGWAVCRAPGLIKDFQNAFAVALKIDGQVLLDGSLKTTKPYWWPTELWSVDEPLCNNHADAAYVAFWLYDLNWLSVGTHTIEWTVTQAHQVTDLYDAAHFLPDGTLILEDGKPDKYPAGVSSGSTTVIVTALP